MENIKAAQLKYGDRFSLLNEGLKNRKMFTSIAKPKEHIIGASINSGTKGAELDTKKISFESYVKRHFKAGERDVIAQQKNKLSKLDANKLERLTNPY
ncbi:MAG: hypothetical protein R6U95_09715 [Bacteroidales bacterium]